MEETPPELAWTWEPFLPRGGLCLFSSYAKLGKSTFIYSLIRSVARGEPFLNLPTRKTNILILAVEEHPRDVRNRLEYFGITPDDDDGIFLHIGPMQPTELTWKAINTFVKEQNIGMVVIDTLAAFWKIVSENDNTEVQAAVAPFLHLARSTDATVVVIHHTSKAEGGSSGGRSIRGASSLLGIMDQAMTMTNYGDREGTQRRIDTIGRYNDTPKTIYFDYVNYNYVFLGTPMHYDMDAVRLAVMDVLQKSTTPLTLNELCGATGMKIPQITKAVALLPEGVVRGGRGIKGEPYTYKWVA